MMQLTGRTRIAFTIFFATHIPITLVIDGQIIFPKSLVPKLFQKLLKYYYETFNDNLMRPPYDNIFFSSFVMCELLFQLPFFFIATYALLTSKISGKGWFRSACIIYGAHTTTTLVPILASIVTDAATTGSQKILLFFFYFPYFVFPLWLTFISATSKDIFLKENEEATVHAKFM
jgi:hypothetical protein